MPCQTEQELWCIFRGDTVVYTFQFWDDDQNQAIPLFGKELWFTMKRKRNQTDLEAGLQKKVVFPDDQDSGNGIGYMTLDAADTDPLDVNKTYFYDFQLVDTVPDPDVVTTVGSGTVPVKQDITVSTS